MSVNPGFGGQKFMPEVLDKIKKLKKIKDQNNYKFDIEVDGGINFSNSKIVLEAGADILVIWNYCIQRKQWKYKN